MGEETIHKRLYVGGLSSDVSSNEIVERFSRFGKVSNISITRRTDEEGQQVKSFAHLDLEGDEASVKKCFSTYQNTKWKGSVLKLQYAKESFLAKLEKEREEPAEKKILTSPRVTSGETGLTKSLPTTLEVKGSAVPGTPVPGKKDWVVGKYGRVLPVLKLKKSYKLKMIKHDPSKYCHAAKVFKEDKTNGLTNVSCDNLTWEIDSPDSDITRKRKGEFPETFLSTKKKKEEPLYFNAHRKPLGTGESHVSDLSFSSNFRSLNSERDSGEFEIVKNRALSKSQTFATTKERSKFDSDVDSDLEVMSTSLIMSTKENKKSVQLKKIQRPTDIQEMDFSVGKCEKSNYASVLEQHTSLANERVKGLHSNEKVPEFMGLQMLGLVSKKSDKVPVAKRQSQNSVLENSGPQSSSSTSPHKEVNNASETGVKMKMNNKKLDAELASMKIIPEFGGLSMLSETISGDRSSSQCRSLTSDDEQQQQKRTLMQSFSGEPMKKLPFSSSALVNMPVSNDGKECYDSSSSADTDEILSRCRSKHGIMSSSTPSTDPNSIQHSARNLSQISYISGMHTTTSLLDQSLYLSENTAGTPELSIVSLRDSTRAPVIQSRPSCDESSDSELDSNDFELVAKRLAEKAASTSKLQNDTSAAPASSQRHVKELAEDSDTQKQKAHYRESHVDKSKQDSDGEKGKHLADNEKRLQAVKDHLKQKQQQQNMMRKALQSVDTLENSSSKRIIFSSSENDTSDDSEDYNDNKSGAGDISPITNRQSKSTEGPGIQERVKKRKKEHSKGKGKLVLLETSSEGEEESDYEEMFKSRPHFEGEKGEKLMKLERKIGDSRFKLDAKFAESDSEEEEIQSKPRMSGKKDADPNLEEEKAASLKVLENVIGKTTLDQFSEKIKRNTKYLIDMNAVRFDPTRVASQTNSSSSSDKKKVATELKGSPASKEHMKKSQTHSEYTQGNKTMGNEKKMLSTDKEKAGTSEDGVKSKHVKKLQKSSSGHEDEQSNAIANQGGKSTVHLATSLVDLFKQKKGIEEEPQSFSLLKQFDMGNEGESDYSDQDASDDNPKKVDDGKLPAVLSGLLKKADLPNISDSTNVASPLGEPEHSDSDSDYSEEELAAENGGRKTGLLEGNTNEDSEEEEEGLATMDDKMPTTLQDEEMDSGSELSSAGRMDVRYTREQWLQRWEEIRPTLVKMFKRKHKDALKSKRAQSQIKRKKEFLTKSRKGYAAHRKR